MKALAVRDPGLPREMGGASFPLLCGLEENGQPSGSAWSSLAVPGGRGTGSQNRGHGPPGIAEFGEVEKGGRGDMQEWREACCLASELLGENIM